MSEQEKLFPDMKKDLIQETLMDFNRSDCRLIAR